MLIVSLGDKKLMGQIDKETEEGVLLMKRGEVVMVSPTGERTRKTFEAVNLVFADELEGIRTAIGTRKVYSTDGKMMTFDPGKGKNDKTKVGRETPLEAIDFAVAWSENAETPVRVIVQTPTGEMGFLDLNRNRSSAAFSFEPPPAKVEVAKARPAPTWQPPKAPVNRREEPAKAKRAEARSEEKRAKKESKREPKKAPKKESAAKEAVVAAVGPPATPSELTGDSKLLWELSTLNLVEWVFEMNKKRILVTGKVQNISTDIVDGGGVRVDFFDQDQNRVASHQVALDSSLEAGEVTEFSLELPPNSTYQRCGVEFNDGKGQILVAFTDYRKIAR